jgi:putative hydrolase of HD superfamily
MIKGSSMTKPSRVAVPELSDDHPEELKLLLDLEALKDLERRNPLSTGKRRECVGEHSWYLALAVLLLRPLADEEIDVCRAVTLAVIHDVVENFAGDTFAFGDTTGQHEREHAAMAALHERSRSDAVAELVELWHEYERQDTPEARFVKGLDAFLPIMQNFRNPNHSSWRMYGVAAEQVRERLRTHGDPGKLLRDIAEEMIGHAHARGVLT